MPVDTVDFRAAEEIHAEQIAALVERTVREIYPQYYRQEIVDTFCRLHGADAVLEDIRRGGVYGLWRGGGLIGTGTRQGNRIARVYVDPAHQGRGYGSLIMDRLEAEAARSCAAAWLEASLPACLLYEHRGYRTVRHDRWPLENGVVLVYEIMEKTLRGENKGAQI